MISLNISSNQIGDEGFESLADIIALKAVQVLKIGHNGMTDLSVPLLNGTLSKFNTLKTFEMDETHLSE